MNPFSRILKLSGILIYFLIIIRLCAGGEAIAANVFLSDPIAVSTGIKNDTLRSYRVLCFHDIRDNILSSFNEFPESTAIDTQDFIKQMAWLKENGYHPISLKNIIEAKAGKRPLPEKAILLTFDDGFKSVYTKVFPILKLLNYPALIAIVGEWIDTPVGQNVSFGDATIPRTQFVNWEEIREMVDSGLIEVASHSHGLHKGITANPQGNSMPSAVVHAFSMERKSYESDEAHVARIRLDLSKSAASIEQHLGQRPQAMIWPYGIYNTVALESAAAAGMPVTMTLEAGPNSVDDSLQNIRRSLLRYDDGISGMIRLLELPPANDREKISAEHFVGISLDAIFDPDPIVQEANLSKVLDRITRLRPSAVVVKAYSDFRHDGVAEALYFPNRHLPLKADLFSRVAWQLRTRAGVKVYASMPVASFDLLPGDAAFGHLVAAVSNNVPRVPIGQEFRLSIFDPAVRNTIAEIYEDLGKSGLFTGIIFGEDAHLAMNEDASPAALSTYHDQWKLSSLIESIQQDPTQLQNWSKLKAQYLDEFILTLAKKIKLFQPDAFVARSIKDKAIMDPQAEIHFSQNYLRSLNYYDFIVVDVDASAYSIEHEADKLNKFVEINAVGSFARQKLLYDFKLQKANPALRDVTPNVAAQIQRLHSKGARHFGYYPDDWINNSPPENVIRAVISTQTEAIDRLK